VSLHRKCCCGDGPSRLWLKPSCNDNPPSTVIVFEQNDCNLTLNNQLYEYDDGSFFGGLKYCGTLRREADFPIPSEYTERIVDSTDCGDIETITCGECLDDLCGYWEDCDGPTITVDGFTDNGWQFPDDGFGQTQQYRARITAVSVGAGNWIPVAGFGYRWEYDITVTAEAELLDASGCTSSAQQFSKECDGEPLQNQTWTWDTPMKLSVLCDGGFISDTQFDPNGPYVCENANGFDQNGNEVPYRDVSKWKTNAVGSATSTSSLAPTDADCVFTGNWSITQPIDVKTDVAEADGGFDADWQDCVPLRGLFLNTIQLTVSGTYS